MLKAELHDEKSRNFFQSMNNVFLFFNPYEEHNFSFVT